MMESTTSLAWLLILPLAVASVTWTVTHEEILREFHDACERRARTGTRLLYRKFFYLFTCEYCFSHYVAALFIGITGYRVLLPDWRGVVLGFFVVQAIANVYMSLFARLRVDIKAERVDIQAKERNIQGHERSDRTDPSQSCP